MTDEESNSAGVHGIGGVFFRSADPAATRTWYAECLGFDVDPWGTSFPWRRAQTPDRAGHTLWSPFEHNTEYFGPADQQFMINFRVDDLDATLAHLQARGVEPVGPIDDQPYGRFAHVVDNDGRRIELWEPNDAAYAEMADGVTDR